MTNKKISDIEENTLVGDGPKAPTVYFFKDANYSGDAQSDSTAIARAIKLDTFNFDGNISSIIVSHGQCETTTNGAGAFDGDSTSYYNANEGLNNQGCYPTLKDSDNNQIEWIRAQRDDIYRPTGVPYLVLRDKGYEGGGTAKIFTTDTADIPAFTAEMFFALGSPTGEWFLYSEPNYQGEMKSLSVSGGDHSQGVYYTSTDKFTVRSVRSSVPDSDVGPWTTYNPSFLDTFDIINNYDYTIHLKVIYRNGDRELFSLSDGQTRTFTFNKSNWSLIGSNNRSVELISLNDDKGQEDIHITDGVGMSYTFRSNSATVDTVKFTSHQYCTYLVDTSGIDSGPKAKLRQEYTESGSVLRFIIERA
ncbi:hypothetical protein ACIPMZ_20915 [Scandinavium goeteborgense]|uniref:hypothetical protein n=1 Tax=Scandinavium goeteborgense TaxID=1851514 RepID=UPI00382D8F29